MSEVPTYRPPAGVNGPTLGRDLPDGCERCLAHADPRDGDYWLAWHDGDRMSDLLYWWRPVPLQVGDRVQLTGTVEDVGSVAAVRIDGAGHRPYSFPTEATPVPPWPGAVLSGLVDEDGVPTWLAQAGQVRGEQVRRRSDFAWVNNDQMVAHLDTVWVEVRAPQGAVPEPETERVPWWEAVGRRWTDGRTVWKVTHSVEGVIAWDNGGEALDVMFSADGTVEVLKDGDR